jgi:hypothetical protein
MMVIDRPGFAVSAGLHDIASLDPQIATVHPAGLPERLLKGRRHRLRFKIASPMLDRTPTRRTVPASCAHATRGHAAAAPPTSVMNSRRLMWSLKLRTTHYHMIEKTRIAHRSIFAHPTSATGHSVPN